ncbi:hypothetical protein QCA50_018554 [Cerrena zonata]|uniref:Uncharacterized protein n=1 Tax=Cerrena zonata TaxID=2478898 RepID=A0AAW0FCJ4_9APHY
MSKLSWNRCPFGSMTGKFMEGSAAISGGSGSDSRLTRGSSSQVPGPIPSGNGLTLAEMTRIVESDPLPIPSFSIPHWLFRSPRQRCLMEYAHHSWPGFRVLESYQLGTVPLKDVPCQNMVFSQDVLRYSNSP